jgi:elongation factor P
MDTTTYEQITLDDDAFGDGPKYLKPNTQLLVSMYQGRPVVVTLPNTVDLEVVDAPPEIKGATAASQNKPLTLETGLVVQGPSFVKVGDIVRIDTRSGEYVTRVKE